MKHRVLQVGAGAAQRFGDGAFPLHAEIVEHEGKRFVQ
jgi:hypothetical protein